MQSEPENQNPQNPDELMRIIAALPPDKRALFEIELTKRAAVSKAPVMQKKSMPSCVASIQAGQSGISIFCFLFQGGFQMEFFRFANLARLIGREHSFYAVIARGADGVSEPHHSVEEMTSRYVQEITSIQPHGPYFLVGECLSAPVAYETARQLRATGEEVGLLALLGARGRPPWFYRYVGTWLGAWLRYHFSSWSTSRVWGFLNRSTPVATQQLTPRLRRGTKYMDWRCGDTGVCPMTARSPLSPTRNGTTLTQHWDGTYRNGSSSTRFRGIMKHTFVITPISWRRF